MWKRESRILIPVKSSIGACVVTLGIATSANAAILPLESRLGGLAYYDPNLEITWVQDANINGMMDWYTATIWASSLDIGGVTGWRLPNMDRDGNGVVVDGRPVSGSSEPCDDNEYGFIYWENGITSDSQSAFVNVQPDFYWSGTEYLIGGLDDAWDFIFNGSTGGDLVYLFGSGLLGLIGIARKKKVA